MELFERRGEVQMSPDVCMRGYIRKLEIVKSVTLAAIYPTA